MCLEVSWGRSASAGGARFDHLLAVVPFHSLRRMSIDMNLRTPNRPVPTRAMNLAVVGFFAVSVGLAASVSLGASVRSQDSDSGPKVVRCERGVSESQSFPPNEAVRRVSVRSASVGFRSLDGATGLGSAISANSAVLRARFDSRQVRPTFSTLPARILHCSWQI